MLFVTHLPQTLEVMDFNTGSDLKQGSRFLPISRQCLSGPEKLPVMIYKVFHGFYHNVTAKLKLSIKKPILLLQVNYTYLSL